MAAPPKKYIFILIPVILVIFVIMFFFSQTSSASTPDDIISATLTELGLSDATYIGVYTDPIGKDQEYVLYHSDDTGYDYYFDPDSGNLIRIYNNSAMSGNLPSLSNAENDTPTDEQRRSAMIEYAESCISSFQIGQLEIVSEHFDNYDYIYEIREFYNGMETGTIIDAMCSPEGVIYYCVFEQGSVFRKNADGSISRNDTDPFISEEDAIQIAINAVDDVSDNKSYSVELKANGNEQYYRVLIEIPPTDLSYNYTKVYDIWVDVTSGEIIAMQSTQ